MSTMTKKQNISYSIIINDKAVKSTPKMIISISAPFLYESDPVVPWKYESQVQHCSMVQTTTSGDSSSSYNITSHRITHSGRVYVLREVQRVKGKAILQKDDEAIIKKEWDKRDDEFLKIMRRSEYDIVE